MESELPSVILLLKCEANLAIKFLLFDSVFHLGTNGVLLCVLVEVECGIGYCCLVQGLGSTRDANTPVESLVEMTRKAEAPGYIFEWLGH